MTEYRQLELFDLDDYTSSEVESHSESLLFFKPHTKVVYKQLELDLSLESQDNKQFFDYQEAA